MLHLERLEGRALLTPVPTLPAAQIERLPHPLLLQQGSPLEGAVHGIYTVDHRKPGSALSLQLHGSGTIQGGDRVKVAGAVTVPASGVTPLMPAGGTLTLSNARGRLVLRLESPAQSAEASPSGQAAFVIQSSTGSYRQLTGGGLIDLGLAAPGRFTLTIAPAPSNQGQPPPPTIATGISGTAVEGPIVPVSRPGEPNTRPLPDAIITIQPAGGGPELFRQQADAQGNFQIALDPGSYEIVPLDPQPGQIFPRGITQDITVLPNQVLDVVVYYDTGIR
jgi:hypothetical protein